MPLTPVTMLVAESTVTVQFSIAVPLKLALLPVDGHSLPTSHVAFKFHASVPVFNVHFGFMIDSGSTGHDILWYGF
jgi:hypothetical protein